MTATPSFPRAACAAPHHLAAEAGRAVLAEGGNAVEATVAMAATIAVVYPHMNGVGGDGFWTITAPGGRTRCVLAAGAAGAGATIARYREAGHGAIPARGPLAALTAPAAVAGWDAALGLARALGGRLPLPDLLHDAVRRAREGCPVSLSEARTAPHEGGALRAAPGFAAAFLDAEGKAPAAGTTRRQPRLADTLDAIARAGLDDFHRGDVGREIAADLARLGSPVTRADLAATRAREAAPLTLRIAGATLHNAPPPTQGLAALVLLGVFERLRERATEGSGAGAFQGESFAHQHALVEATKRALSLRDRAIADPARMTDDPATFLAPAFLDAEAGAVDAARAAPWPAAPSKGDTVWMGCVDASGLAVSYIQSLYWEWGSGVVLPATGVLVQNRGVAFSLDERQRTALAPGRLPPHTLIAPMAVFDDGRMMPFGAMGGDGQPQFSAQVFARAARFGAGLAEAVEAPRFLLGRTWGAPSASLKLEGRFDPALIARLRRAGHEVEEWPAPFDDAFGHAGALVRHPDGRVEAAHDPRADTGPGLGAAGL